MKKITKEDAIRLHRELWNWVAKTGNIKSSWPKWDDIIKQYDRRIAYDCFCCEYALQELGLIKYRNDNDRCKACPLDWTNGGIEKYHVCVLEGEYGLFDEYIEAIEANDVATIKGVAEIIANLPMKEGELEK